jgi:hypothetical protein
MLPSPTSGGRSVGIVRLRTTATEFSLIFSFLCYHYRVECCELAWNLSLIGERPNKMLALNPTCLCLVRRKPAKGVECNQEPDALRVSLSTLAVVESRNLWWTLSAARMRRQEILAKFWYRFILVIAYFEFKHEINTNIVEYLGKFLVKMWTAWLRRGP